jgi:ketosteroid isomerase-like protein
LQKAHSSFQSKANSVYSDKETAMRTIGLVKATEDSKKGAGQAVFQGLAKRHAPRICITMFVMTCVLVGPISISQAANQAIATAGPTAENALAADEALAQAIRDNDADAILRLLDNSWVVIATTGSVGEGPSIFHTGIKSGYLTRKTFELSEPRVRVYGDVALVTSIVKTSGVLQGQAFNVVERQTDVLHWANGSWKCLLTHETKIKNN